MPHFLSRFLSRCGPAAGVVLALLPLLISGCGSRTRPAEERSANPLLPVMLILEKEIRGKIPGDYGRDRGIAWYYLGGFGITHTQAAQSRILLWDSAG